MTGDEDEYVAVGRQFGLFVRRADRFFQGLQLDADGRQLERAAYGLLGCIASEGPRRLSALAGDACVDVSTVSRQVATLESAGLVRRAADPGDRRASLIEATDTGLRVFAQNRAKWLSALRELLADWTPAERQEFATLFARLNDAIDARTPSPTTGPAPSHGNGPDQRKPGSNAARYVESHGGTGQENA